MILQEGGGERFFLEERLLFLGRRKVGDFSCFALVNSHLLSRQLSLFFWQVELLAEGCAVLCVGLILISKDDTYSSMAHIQPPRCSNITQECLILFG